MFAIAMFLLARNFGDSSLPSSLGDIADSLGEREREKNGDPFVTLVFISVSQR